MSNEPIFEKLAAEKGYKALLESIHRRPISNLFANRVQARVVTQDGLKPDPYLDGPMHLIEKEPEVVVRPFVPVQGVPRGMSESLLPLTLHQPMPGIGISAAEILEPLDKLAHLPEDSQLERYRTPKIEAVFDPTELVMASLTFQEFTQKAIEDFTEKYPDAEGITLSLKPGTDFSKEDQTLIVEGRISVPVYDPQEPLSDILRDFRATMAQQHPGYVSMAVTAIQRHEDGSATLTVEGQSVEIKNYTEMQQKLGGETGSPVKPLSEKNTAQLME